ncbi:hypothetical protein AMJ40_02165 [candidate division TA06 bacterium DG_26]|uniref:Uncharacterized protein n=1 Tax=candidate division TA06 bacterium DG_26 TaxID=1703771 RepID=A0A0S7WKR4_UNCT6|nr:MAG: hypothetical protein AMJ40_02165 [candidate division TA06 bacterium DG_26]
MLLVCTGCTYSFNPALYSDIKSVAIPVFENETVKYGLSETITEKLIQAFMQDGTLKIKDEREADSILMGRVVSYERVPFIYDEYETISSFRTLIKVTVQFRDRVRDRILWTQEFQDWGSYPADGDESEGVEEALEKLKDQILREIIEGW